MVHNGSTENLEQEQEINKSFFKQQLFKKKEDFKSLLTF